VNLRLRIAKIVFCRQPFATQYKSGRRKPTVANQHYCTGVSYSHGGLTPAALENVRLFIAKTVFFERMLVVPAPRVGGVSPPWETNAGASALNYHGGLTPAALAKVRLYSANVVFRSEVRCAPWQSFSPANRHRATKSGGA
jgi:hypothetical protein